VFEEVWEGRVFGLTMALHEAGLFPWDEFRGRLIEAIAAWDASDAPRAAWRYYDRWLIALERVLAERGLCAPAELETRTRALAARPPGHDHGR
jgi:nitrile hydratase accessory protein